MAAQQPRPIRFGFQATGDHLADIAATAQRAEAAGFDTLCVADHVPSGLSPMLALATAAAATERIRLGTMVLNNDMRNPVQLAWEAATLDRLSGGRFELGLGAGHTPAEYAATGIGLGSAAVRKRRLMESVEVLKALLAGETVTHSGEFFTLDGATAEVDVAGRVPILVGGNGARLLEHAGRFADIVGLQGMGRTLADGHRHEVNWTIEHLEAQIDQVRAGAGDRFGDVELSALVQLVAVTNDAAGVLEPLVDRVDGLTMDAAAAAPYLLVGTEAEIVDKVKRCRDQWGITYFVVRELDAMQPIITAFRD